MDHISNASVTDCVCQCGLKKQEQPRSFHKNKHNLWWQLHALLISFLFFFFFVLMNTVCPALICLLVLCKVVKSNRSILKSTRNSILSMKVKHLVWKNHTSSSLILGYVVNKRLNEYICWPSHSSLMPFCFFLITCMSCCVT